MKLQTTAAKKDRLLVNGFVILSRSVLRDYRALRLNHEWNANMAFAAQHVLAGQDYVIIQVDGCPPESLDDFTGDMHLTLVRAGQHLHVTGAVARTAESVRFYQQDLALPDRNIRVLTITAQDDSIFLAAPHAAFRPGDELLPWTVWKRGHDDP